ncbi:Nn.00g074950.m01.CDS01 [Neocucurbitaria sp. VM-36]
MSSYKRHRESQSRGNSPPEKRSRPPERSASMQERSNKASSSRNPSPFAQRKNSAPGLTAPAPKATSGLNTKQYDPRSRLETTDKTIQNGGSRPVGDTIGRNDFHTSSAGSGGSGASTPVRAAPPVPSMLPVSEGSASTGHLPQQEQAASLKQPRTLASLQRLKTRKTAMGHHAKSIGLVVEQPLAMTITTSQLNVQLKAHQIEITHLKKALNELSKSRKDEVLPAPSNQQRTITDRLEKFEKSSLPAELSSTQISIEQFKALSDRVGGLEAAALKRDKEYQTLAKENEKGNTMLETIPDIKNDIDSLKSWKTTQSNMPNGVQLKDMILQEVKTTLDEAKTALKKENEQTEIHLTKRIDDHQKNLTSLSSGFNMSQRFQRDMEKQNLPDHLDDLSEQVRVIERNESSTYKETKANREDIDQLRLELDKHIGPFKEEHKSTSATIIQQIKSIRNEQAKLLAIAEQMNGFKNEAARLSSEQKELSTSQNALSNRADALERISATAVSSNPAAETNKALIEDINERLDKIDVKVVESQRLVEQVQSLESKVTEVEKSAENTTRTHKQFTKDIESLHGRISKLDVTLAEMQVPKPTNQSGGAQLEPLRTEIGDLKQNIALLAEGLEEAERNIHEHSNDISGLQEDVPALFREKLDPFKRKVEQQLETIYSSLNLHIGEDAGLNQSLRSSTQSPGNDTKALQMQLDGTTRDLQRLQEEIKGLQTSTNQKMTIQDFHIQGVKEKLGSKADNAAMTAQLDIIKAAQQVQQDQYNNITTDELHQRMVHWFVSTYPNAQTLLHQFSGLQQELHRLQPLIAQMDWIQSRSQDLTMLLNNAPHLHILLQSSAELNRLPGSLAKIDQASTDAKTALIKIDTFSVKMDQQAKQIDSVRMAISKTEKLHWKLEEQAKQIETVQGALSGLESSIHTLNPSSLYARIEAVDDINQAIKDLGGHFDQRFADERQARVNSNNEMNDKTKAMAELLEAIRKELTSHTAFSQGALGQLREDFDTVNEKYIEPNKDIFGSFTTMVVIIAQLQAYIESVNEGLKHPITIAWDHDLNALLEPQPQEPDNQDGSGSSKKKDKSKE